jgi:hypothetical protein
MFFIRYKDTETGEYQQLTLTPGPTTVQYPEKRQFKLQVTPDGAAVISRPMRDNRTRRWVWKRYRPWIATYENQWDKLEKLEYRTRLRAGKPPIVEVWEDESTIGGFNEMLNASTKKWTRVKFLRVERTIADGGGSVIYEESFVEFVIVDDQYSAF